MTREFYFQMLRKRLRKLPDDDRKKILAFYQEIAEDKLESGIPEEQVLADLGDVQQLAQKILAENPNRKTNGSKPFLIALGVTAIVLLLFTGIFYASFLLPGKWASTISQSQIEGSSEIVALSPSESYPEPSQPISNAGQIASAVKETKEYILPMSDVEVLKLDVENKEIYYEATEGTDIRVQYETDKTQIYHLLQEKPGEYEVKNEDLRRDDSSKLYRITVQVPKAYFGKLKAETGNGYIEAKELQNLDELKVEAANASVSLEKISAREISVETSNGSAFMDTVQAGEELDIETKNGEIGLQSCLADAVEIDSGNGQVSMRSVEAALKIHVETRNGMIDFTGLCSPDIGLKTQNGAVSGSVLGKKEDYQIQTNETLGGNNLQNKDGGTKKLRVETRIGAIDVTFEE